IKALRDRFEHKLQTQAEDVSINGDPENRLPNTTSLAFQGVEAQGLLLLLDEGNICASAGSACHTGALHPSDVLFAMGHSRDRAASTLRFSLSEFTTENEIDLAVDH